ncbi:MAG: hypothetical protein V2J25_15055, partial [Desulfatiglans sp.]|nr:hypothetical protein [Desulfatiglans sp.]
AAIRRLNEFYQPGEKIRPHTERSRELERVITTSFLSCDAEAFKRAVDEWEAFFLSGDLSMPRTKRYEMQGGAIDDK